MTPSTEQIVEVINKDTSPSTSESTDLGNDPSEVSVSRELSAGSVLGRVPKEEPCGERSQSHATIDMLPDDVLLEVFDIHREDPTCISPLDYLSSTWRWGPLIQVCRRWRCVIFGSPRRLDLRLVCTHKTPTRTSLDIWPPFPISITCWDTGEVDEESIENVVAAVEHGHDRISRVAMYDINDSALEKLAAATQQPLPTLGGFLLRSSGKSGPVLPETFLGGSAPLLETFQLHGIPFPTLPQFISSSIHIRFLSVLDIPQSGYISPNAMVACLAALPNLRALTIGFRSPLSRPPQLTPPPRTRIVLPALTQLCLCGVSEYFEDFVTRIDTPLLNKLHTTFFMDLIFDIPRLRHFISRAERLEPLNQASVAFDDRAIWIGSGGIRPRFGFGIRCERPDWQLSSMVQIFGQQLPLLSHVEHLHIYPEHRAWMDNPDMDSSLWLELFRLFIAVQSLRVSGKLVPLVAAALQELSGEKAVEVLPALHSLSLEGPGPVLVPKGIKTFVAARELSDHPVAVQIRNNDQSDND